jgi:hypothetical protein
MKSVNFDFVTQPNPLIPKMSDAALMLNHANASRALDKAIHAYDLATAWKWTTTVVDLEIEFMRRRAK